jgi:hypothetical protein
MPVLIGETYLHKPTGRLLVVVDFELRPPPRSRAHTRGRRVVVKEVTGATWASFTVSAAELEERPGAP